jgi:hypothetical protein
MSKVLNKRHDHALETTRRVMLDACLEATPYLGFGESRYQNKNGQMRPMIEVSEIALPAVVGRIGGKAASAGMIHFGEEFLCLKRAPGAAPEFPLLQGAKF